ncbi:DUF6597 domain-containing transcriptional factor [Hyphococcus sp. DH-69]|uniref:DUF6597 domain-containing transcriptional factor n=1 Tax=Hyphococcus formosus TaxID=3143534 RepID=UPI00398A74E6
MELRYYMPRSDLRDYVRAYYFYSVDIASSETLCAELGNIRVILRGGGMLQMPGGQLEPSMSAFLLGPTLGSYNLMIEPKTAVFGVGIRPEGWHALFGVSAEELADKVIDLTAFSGGILMSSIEEIRNAETLAEMSAAADRYFVDQLNKREAHIRQRYPVELANWLLDPNDLGLDALMEAMDVSRRQTDRLAKLYFGASPKFLQRKYRALRAADRIRAGETAWMNAAGSKFYDQSHFIKEFKTFIGVTPKQFIDNQARLIAQIQQMRVQSALQIPLASF